MALYRVEARRANHLQRPIGMVLCGLCRRNVDAQVDHVQAFSLAAGKGGQMLPITFGDYANESRRSELFLQQVIR
ncbi:MAG: hypothetical protein ACXWNK_14690 [Vulcanimicrobiaceae bacterium]